MTVLAPLSTTVRAAFDRNGAEAVLDLARAARGPLVEPTADPDRFRVSFVYADRSGVSRVGLFCAGLPGGFLQLVPLADGVFAASAEFPRGTRVKYHFCPDPPERPDRATLAALDHSPTRRRIDYLNPVTDQVHIRGLRIRIIESLLTLPGAAEAPPLRAAAGVPTGRSETVVVDSAALGRRKEVRVRLPAGHRSAAGPWEAVLLLEGNEEWRADGFLDNLAAGRPIVAVVPLERAFTSRQRELSGNPAYTRFVVDELWPLLQDRYGVAERATVAGYSVGGLAAAALALDEPHRFPRLAVISGALHLRPGVDLRHAPPDTSVLRRYEAAGPALPARAYLAAGWFEDAWADTIGEQSARLAAILRAGGSTVRLDTSPTGHDTVSARAYLAAGLDWLTAT